MSNCCAAPTHNFSPTHALTKGHSRKVSRQRENRPHATLPGANRIGHLSTGPATSQANFLASFQASWHVVRVFMARLHSALARAADQNSRKLTDAQELSARILTDVNAPMWAHQHLEMRRQAEHLDRIKSRAGFSPFM